jgi:gliding motility-associated-like protein
MGSCAQKTFLLTVIPVTVATPVPRDTTYCLGVTPPDLSYNVTGTFLNYYTSATGGTGTTVPPVPSTASIGTTTYYVSQIVTGCASTRVPLNITVVDPPSIFLSNNGPLCPGDRLNITLTDTTGATGVTFTWSGPGGYTATTQNVNIFSATAADSGVYTVVANINGCATYPTSNTVIVRNTPPSPVYSNPTYCQYLSSVPLSAVGSNILWYTSATGGIGSTVAPTPSTTVAGTFTWYVTQTVNGCQSARYPVIVTVNPKPAPPTVTNNPGSYCPRSTFVASTFAAGTGSTLWYSTPTGGTGSSTEPVISTTFPGSFTNYVSQTLLGCESDRSPLTITIYDTVRARYSANVDWGCDADTVSFTNTSYGAINYRWEFGDGTSSITANPSHIYNRQSVYIVKLFAHSAYCVDSLISTIDLNHPNNASFTLSPSVVCQGSPVTFKNTTVALPSGASYTWHFGDGATSRLDSAIHSYKKTGTYRVMLVSKDFVPCLDTAYGTVTVDSMSDLNLDFSDTAICRGAYVTLDADFSSIGNTEFIWDFGNNDSVRNINPVVYAYPAAGTYTVTATARYRVCNNISKSRTIFVGNTPNIDLGPDTLICSGSTSIILADLINSASGSGFSWRWGTGERSASIAVTSAGVFYATVTKDGCSATDSVIVSDDCYLKFPTCFTPNLDGLNDYFNPRDFMLKGLKTFKMSIYNRWGQLIFESSNTVGKGWDGNFNDVPQPTGVYIYQVEATFNDGQRLNKHGNITLLK